MGLSTFSILLDVIWFILYGSGSSSVADGYRAGGSYTFAIVLTVVSLIIKVKTQDYVSLENNNFSQPLSVYRTWALIRDRGDDGALHIGMVFYCYVVLSCLIFIILDWSTSPKVDSPLVPDTSA